MENQKASTFFLGFIIGALTAVVIQLRLEERKRGDIIYNMTIPKDEVV